MYETNTDIRSLEQLIDDSIANAGAFLKQSFEMPEKSLSAGQLINRFDGVSTLALATVSSTGIPRVAPVIAVFYRAKFHIPTVVDALRTRHVRNNPEVSLTAYEGIDFAVIVHGKAMLVTPEHSEFEQLREIQIERNESDITTWGDPVYLRIDPTHLFSFARYPDRFPEPDQ